MPPRPARSGPHPARVARPVAPAPHARLRFASAVLLLGLSLACQPERQDAPPPLPEAGSLPRVTSLIREAERAEAAAPESWDLDFDTRRTLVVSPGAEIVLSKIALDPSCSLRTGLTLQPAQWRSAGPTRLRIDARREDADEEDASITLLDQVIDPVRAPSPRWWDRTIDLAPLGVERARYTLTLSAAVDDTGSRHAQAKAGFGTTWLSCRDAAKDVREPATPHVLLVSLDTLRADHLGVYGYAAGTSPALDRFAAGATVFENAFSTAPWTLPSHASMFTGLYPDQHGGGHAAPFTPLGKEPPTLAETLGKAGYRSMAVTAAGVVSRAQGLARGFGDWREHPRVNLRSLMPEVLDALTLHRERDERPLFLFLHTYDIHGPYDQPRGLRAQPRQTPDGRTPEERARWQAEREQPHHGYLELDRYRDLQEVIDAYDAGIRFVDAQLARLFEWLERTGTLERSLVIVTSDHGETFFDHGLYIGHSFTLYDTELRVPLIVRPPGPARPARSEALIDLTDLAPMVLETAGLAVPAHWPGANALSRAAGAAPARHSIRAEAAHSGSSTLRSRRYKVISAPWGFDEARMRVSASLAGRFPEQALAIDLERDPQEARNLDERAASLPAEVAELREQLGALDRPGQASVQRELDQRGRMDESFLEQLRALGYIEAESPREGR